MSESLQPHGLQHIRFPCPSLSPGVCSNWSIESVMPSNHLIPCHPLLLLPSVFPRIRVFSNKSALHIRWPKIYVYVYVCIYSSILNHSKICFLISLSHLPQPQPVDKSLLIARERFSATEKIHYSY